MGLGTSWVFVMVGVLVKIDAGGTRHLFCREVGEVVSLEETRFHVSYKGY